MKDKVKYEEPKLYYCDPAKHTKCKRNSCYKYGGMCRWTRYPEYAKTDKNSKPIISNILEELNEEASK